jgi:hypothetical protein
VNPPGTFGGLAGQFLWLDATFDPQLPSNAWTYWGPFTDLQMIAIVRFDEWCRGRPGTSPTLPTYDSFPATSPNANTLQTLRFSIEKKDTGFWRPDLSGNNLQSFLVMVVE